MKQTLKALNVQKNDIVMFVPTGSKYIIIDPVQHQMSAIDSKAVKPITYPAWEFAEQFEIWKRAEVQPEPEEEKECDCPVCKPDMGEDRMTEEEMEEIIQSLFTEQPLPDWAKERAIENYISPLQQVLTKDGRRTGNGTVINMAIHVDLGAILMIVTDAGNVLKLTLPEFHEMFHLGDYIQHRPVYEGWERVSEEAKATQ